jgi:hypothetical protein
MSGTLPQALGAYAAFIAPHSSATGTVTVTASGFQPFTASVTIPANSKYAPYTFTNGFAQESGRSGSLAASIASLYNTNTAYTVTINGVSTTRWGLLRDPDYGGLNFWTGTAAANGWTGSTQAFRDTFFQAIENQGSGNDYSRARTSSKSFETNTGYGDLSDRP